MTTAPSIQRIADELEIRNLLGELTYLADTATDEQLERYLSLFTEDATWAVISDGVALASQERAGRQAILEGAQQRRASGAQGPGSGTRHALHTIHVRFDSDDEAYALCYWHYYKESSSDRPVLAAMGEYRNRLVRTRDGWRLARRELVQG